MESEELASKLDALQPGECLTVPLREVNAIFGPIVLQMEALERAIAFAAQHDCRFLYYEFEHREPEFFKVVC